MIRLEMSNQEAMILRDSLRQFDSDSRFEIARTDSHDFRQELREKEEVLARLIERLDQQLTSDQAPAA